MKKILSGAAIIIFSATILSAQIDIEAARLMPANSTVIIRGIVTNGAELGTVRYVQDTSGGIALYDASLSSLQRGDSVVATGTLTDYQTLMEVNPITTHTVLTTGNNLPAPHIVTPSQIGESLESQLVRINNVVFQTNGVFAGNSSYNFTSNSQSGSVYVRTGSPLIGQVIPTGYLTLYGIVSEYLSAYQVLPRDAADIISNSSITMITVPTQSNTTTTGFNINWNTNISGSTYIRYGRTPALELGMINGAAGTSHTATISGANPADIFFIKAYSVNGVDTAFSAVKSFATISASTGSIKVYFDKSVDTTLSTGVNAIMLFHTIDDTLIEYINRAKYTIDIAIYSFDNSNISNISTALNNAYARGVKIRLVSDGSNTNPALAQLNSAIPKIASPTTSAYGIMHNKFMIIDAKSANPNDPILWTGSTNWTDNQTGTDANNVIIFQDQSIAKGYKIEFEEMWGDTGMTPNLSQSKFGPYKIDNTPHEYTIGGKRVENYFSPSDGTGARILEKLNTANTQLCIETMEITRTDFAYGITNASAAGISTYVLVDDSSTTTVWSILSGGLLPGHLAYYHASGIMHHKYMIVDADNINSDPLVETGSHNWTTAADTKNDENIVVVHDATIANIYYQEFVPRFTQSGGILGISEIEKNNISISVYPNPSRDNCFIKYELNNSDNLKLSVSDLQGKTIKMMNTTGIPGENLFELNMSELTPGIYLLKLEGKNCNAFYKVVKE